MNLLANERVDLPIVERLRADGHTVAYVPETEAGASDDHVLSQANLRSSLLITADKDFGELVYRQRRIHSGVILLRFFSGLSTHAKSELVSRTLRDQGQELLGAFSVVTPGIVRIRPSI